MMDKPAVDYYNIDYKTADIATQVEPFHKTVNTATQVEPIIDKVEEEFELYVLAEMQGMRLKNISWKSIKKHFQDRSDMMTALSGNSQQCTIMQKIMDDLNNNISDEVSKKATKRKAADKLILASIRLRDIRILSQYRHSMCINMCLRVWFACPQWGHIDFIDCLYAAWC